MELYGEQLAPLLTVLAERGGARSLRKDGSFHERALYRATLRAWIEEHGGEGSAPPVSLVPLASHP